MQSLNKEKTQYAASKQEIWQTLSKIYDLKGFEKRNLVAFL